MNNQREVRKIYRSNTKALQPVRVAAYARVSRDKDAAEHSFVNQVKHYTSYISRMPNTIFAGIYADYGISGTTDKRPEFQRLLADCRAGKIQKVITKSISRFGRNTLVVLESVRELTSLGISVYFEKEGIDTATCGNELFITALATAAQLEAGNTSYRVKWGILYRFSQGIPTYSRPYGYIMKDHHFEIVPEEAEVIKRIFLDYLDGYGCYRIAKRLNEDGIKPLRYDQWSPGTIKGILKNEKYTGDLLLQKSFSENYLTKRKVYNHGEKNQYFVPDAHQAIIPKSVFDQVQAKMARGAERNRNPHTSTPNPDHLFTGYIFCGNCGNKFCHKFNNRHQKHYWSCNTYQTHGKSACPNGLIPEDILIEKTKKALRVSDLTPDILKAKLDKIIVPEHHKLQYHLLSGECVSVTWQHKSRKESWTPEMKAQARNKSLILKEKEANYATSH